MPQRPTDAPSPASADLAQVLLRGGQPRVGNDISLRKLQIFWAVAHAGSLTRAAKILSLTQPTVSQQLAALEANVGNRLFDRTGNSLMTTEFGLAFLRHAETLLRAAQELEDMVQEFGKGQMQTVRVAGVPSALRALMPPAMLALRDQAPHVDFDMHEGGPAEILDMLYARRINLALLASSSVGDLTAGFAAIPLISDPYVLVVPDHIDLGAISDLERDLPQDLQDFLRRTIQFSFGNQHSKRLQHWFDTVLPGNRIVARARSFELVVEMVRAGLGICVAPALSAAPDAVALKGVRLYRLDLAPREIVGIIPAHYQRLDPYAGLLAAMQQAAAILPQPRLAPQPPFIAARFKSA